MVLFVVYLINSPAHFYSSYFYLDYCCILPEAKWNSLTCSYLLDAGLIPILGFGAISIEVFLAFTSKPFIQPFLLGMTVFFVKLYRTV